MPRSGRQGRCRRPGPTVPPHPADRPEPGSEGPSLLRRKPCPTSQHLRPLAASCSPDRLAPPGPALLEGLSHAQGWTGLPATRARCVCVCVWGKRCWFPAHAKMMLSWANVSLLSISGRDTTALLHHPGRSPWCPGLSHVVPGLAPGPAASGGASHLLVLPPSSMHPTTVSGSHCRTREPQELPWMGAGGLGWNAEEEK